uniref:NADH-ubiquinone oxidoreductase chain 6 n=1 Tax=Chaetocnema depressa TaxID=1425539 RepID=A0A3G1GPG2_9CUCU|nr:NADH dehydrogenase subunit 6 [Chaetocnema depressa]
MLTLMILMTMNSLMLILMNHPLTCGLILLLQTILTSIFTGMLKLNFWYSYMLFLIMIGGMLILFIYMTSIASNEKFKFNFFMLMLMLLFIMMSMIFLYEDSFYMFNEIYTLNKKENYINSFKKYMKFPNYFMMLMMMIYLFITLILVVKITKIFYGPLRQKF